MKQLIKKVKQFSILLLVISFIGCEKDDVSLPEVISSFTYTINADTGTVTFINTSVNARNYFWEFGDGTSSTLKNPINNYEPGEYTVTLKAINVAGAFDTSEAIIVISDVGAPVITLLGDTTINILVGDDPYVDPGATATDDVDGDLTANIVVVGVDAVDVNTAGMYTITYNVSDAAGNAATERTRTVIVAADTVAPVITLTGSATINIMVGETYTDQGATATDDIDGDITANIVVAGDTVDANTAGTYTITYNVSDAAGNAATEVTRTVIVDTVPGPSGAYIYATSATVTIPSTIDNWDSGTTIDSDYSGDATYNPSIQLISGTNWGDVSALAFTEMEAGILSQYANLEFKIKTTDYTTIRVKVPENEIGFNISSGTPLADGWVQMSLPLSNWSNEVAAADQFAILEFGAGTILITDVMLSGEGSGGGGGGGGGGTFSLTETIDFEPEGFGANWTWNVFENTDANPPLEFIANPVSGGINTSATVAKHTALQAGAPWAGTETAHGQMGITWDLNASNAIIKIMVYKTVISDVAIKLVNPSGGAQEQIYVPNTVTNQWEELTFDFSSRIGNGLDGSTNIDQIVVFPDFNTAGRTSDNVTYFDNITFN